MQTHSYATRTRLCTKLNCRYIVVEDVALNRWYVGRPARGSVPVSGTRSREVKGVLNRCIKRLLFVGIFLSLGFSCFFFLRENFYAWNFVKSKKGRMMITLELIYEIIFVRCFACFVYADNLVEFKKERERERGYNKNWNWILKFNFLKYEW